MDAKELINLIHTSPKVTPIHCYVQSKCDLDFTGFSGKVFGGKGFYILIGEYKEILYLIKNEKENIFDFYYELDRINSAIPLLRYEGLEARIEPGAIIRDQVEIGKHAVIMMGAIINIGAQIGEDTMIDMGVVLGGRAIVGNRCHIGAGTVLAGVIEPASSQPVVIEDDVLIGANAVVIEGVRVGHGAVVAAGSVVISDVQPNTVVAGVPAKLVKMKDEKTSAKTALIHSLRSL